MNCLKLQKSKVIETGYVQLCQYKKEWRVYAFIYTEGLDSATVQQVSKFKSFAEEINADKFYNSLDTCEKVSEFIHNVN